MGDTRIGSRAGFGPAEQEEARRRSAEATVQTASADASRQSANRRPIIAYLPPVSDDVLRAFAENASARVPPAVADLTLYTDQVLEREIDASRGRLRMRGGADADAAINAERTVPGRADAQ